MVSLGEVNEELQQILKEKFDQKVHTKNEFPYQA